ncbi:murein biosynthesis integral membrane protein MurJ [Rubritepida flocculans]|uniref:murein biosynthesis integral membrane protein MurJ n=1 Tax=Rubritepida flocculans TaxID=182403 RepID=UPI0004194DCB|nr:murein biosynthesis integral membrane protein MurJ [Rubritepida flocculans]
MLRSIATVGGWTMASRILGFARDVLIAAKLGAGPVADAFFVALKLPNLFRRLFGEGAFNAAFVPAFAATLTREGFAEAQRLAERMAGLMGLWLALLTLLGLLFAPQILTVLAPGFTGRPAQFALAVELTRIVFPYLLLICLAALVSGVLNGLSRFAAAAAAPVFFNVMAMAALLGLTPFVATPAHALAWGVLASGVLQLGLVWWAARQAGMALNPFRRLALGEGERMVLRRMVPGVIGAGVTQLNLAVDVIIASLLPTGAVAFLYYADRVAQLPLGVVGAAIGTALLPLLAGQIAARQPLSAHRSQNRALEVSLALTLPAAVALAVLAAPIIAVLFERGAFDAAASAETAMVLRAYAFGLVAFVLVKALTPAFFARGDTRTPVLAGLLAVAANLGLNLLFLAGGGLGAAGIALATGLAAWLNVALLGGLLMRRSLLVLDRSLRRRLPRLLGAALLMGALLALPGLFGLPQRGAMGALVLGASCALGLVAFFGLAHLLGGLDLRQMRGLLRRRRA